MALWAEPGSVCYSPIVHEGHEAAVNSVTFSPDGKSVASGSEDKTIRIWDAFRPSPVCEPFTGHTGDVMSVSYSPLGDVVASGSYDWTIRLWDVNNGQQLGEALNAQAGVNSVAFSPNAKLIASGSWKSTVQLWEVRRRAPASNSLEGHNGWTSSVQFSPDGARVVSGSGDGTIRIWDVERGVTIIGPFKGHTQWIDSVAFSPDASQIVSCSGDRTLRLWDARSGDPISQPYEGHTGTVYSVAFSPGGTYVASGAYDETVRLWDIRKGNQVDQPFQDHNGIVFSVAFSPCGQYLASGSLDCKVIIRSVLGKVPNPTNNPQPQVVTSQMSTQQIFDCLINAGCSDLSSQMDTTQDTAMIVSGGGFGDIWMGKLHNGVKVAIKAWRTNALEQRTDKALKRAARELFCWSRMQHPNIHQLMGAIMFKDQYLGMVSEWMENGNLHEYLRKHPNANHFQLCIGVASGLEYMHSQSTVHGDLKANNVLVSSDGTARVSDFDFSIMSGVSSLVFTQSSNTRTGSIRWTAPEILREEVRGRTTQSDVYALGMTMLEIFTRNVPYPERRMDFSVMNAVTQGILPIRPMDQLQDDQRGNTMWHLLLDCWAQSPVDRPVAGHVLEVVSRLALSQGRT